MKRLQGSISIANAEFRLEQAKAGTDELKELNDQIGKLNEDLEKEASKNNKLQKQLSDSDNKKSILEKIHENLKD